MWFVTGLYDYYRVMPYYEYYWIITYSLFAVRSQHGKWLYVVVSTPHEEETVPCDFSTF